MANRSPASQPPTGSRLPAGGGTAIAHGTHSASALPCTTMSGSRHNARTAVRHRSPRCGISALMTKACSSTALSRRPDGGTERWLAGPEPGATIHVEKVSELAHAWRDDRLSPDWRPRTARQPGNRRSAGPTADFWCLLTPSACRAPADAAATLEALIVPPGPAGNDHRWIRSQVGRHTPGCSRSSLAARSEEHDLADDAVRHAPTAGDAAGRRGWSSGTSGRCSAAARARPRSPAGPGRTADRPRAGGAAAARRRPG